MEARHFLTKSRKRTYGVACIIVVALCSLIILLTAGDASSSSQAWLLPELAKKKLGGTSLKVRTIPTDPIAHFDGSRRFSAANPAQSAPPVCRTPVVAVVTTIFVASKAILQLAKSHPDVPIVVVGDKKGPQTASSFGASLMPNVHFYSTADQETLAAQHGGLAAFVNQMPWFHFGRKNVGYLIAIKDYSPCTIWDFDDDNILKDGIQLSVQAAKASGGIEMPGTGIFHIGVRNRCRDLSYSVTNPYLGLHPSEFMWPRGFPLELLADERTGSACTTAEFVRIAAPPQNIAVFQSSADGDPDVDAIFRLTEKTVISFDGPLDTVLVSPGVYAPYNAQATLQKSPAFFSMYLPITVHGRISDIWRSYIATSIFQLTDLHVGFTAPWVIHERSAHNLRGDLLAEQDLYELAGSMLGFLTGWVARQRELCQRATCSVPALMEDIYIKLFEHGVLGSKDVEAVQDWLAALQAIGYAFPPIVTSPSEALISPERPAAVAAHAAVHIDVDKSAPQAFWHLTYAAQFESVSYHFVKPAVLIGRRVPQVFPHLSFVAQQYQTDTAAGAVQTFVDAWASTAEQAQGLVIWLHDDVFVHPSLVAAAVEEDSMCFVGPSVSLSTPLGPQNNWKGTGHAAYASDADRFELAASSTGLLCGDAGKQWPAASFLFARAEAFALSRSCASSEVFVDALRLSVQFGLPYNIGIATLASCVFSNAQRGPWPASVSPVKTPHDVFSAFDTEPHQVLGPLRLADPVGLVTALYMRDSSWQQ
jgi:hypothetical protein